MKKSGYRAQFTRAENLNRIRGRLFKVGRDVGGRGPLGENIEGGGKDISGVEQKEYYTKK